MAIPPQVEMPATADRAHQSGPGGRWTFYNGADPVAVWTHEEMQDALEAIRQAQEVKEVILHQDVLLVPERVVVSVTEHAVERAKERLGWSRPALLRMALKAKQEGLVLRDTAGGLHRYIASQHMAHKGHTSIIHGLAIFIFGGHVLITVIPVPPKYRKAVGHTRSKKIQTVTSPCTNTKQKNPNSSPKKAKSVSSR